MWIPAGFAVRVPVVKVFGPKRINIYPVLGPAIPFPRELNVFSDHVLHEGLLPVQMYHVRIRYQAFKSFDQYTVLSLRRNLDIGLAIDSQRAQ